MSDCPIKPLGSRIVLKALDKSTTTASGIIIPDTVSKDKPEQGEVIAVGPGKMMENGQREAMDIKPGDKVLFSKYGPNEFEVNNQKYLIIDMDSVQAVIS